MKNFDKSIGVLRSRIFPLQLRVDDKNFETPLSKKRMQETIMEYEEAIDILRSSGEKKPFTYDGFTVAVFCIASAMIAAVGSFLLWSFLFGEAARKAVGL
jgi:hypothetical protein